MTSMLPSEMQEYLGSKAKHLRKQHKLTQNDLAKKSGVSLASLKRFEQTGKVSLESLLKIAQVLESLESFKHLFEPKRELPKSLDELIPKKQK